MTVTRWLVELKGEQFDLEEFPRWFPDGENFVVREGDSYYLTGPAFEKFTETTSVRDAAFQVVDELFALASLFVPNLRKPTVGSRVIREQGGARRQDTVIALGTAEMRMKAHAPQILVGGKPVTPQGPTQAQRLLGASRANTHLNTAVMLWADPPHSWPRLYRILEEIESALGRTVDAEGICSANERELFRRTANTAEVAGKDARHAAGKFEAPKNPMSLQDADAFVRRMLSAALEKKA
jgi:hypothetical protein